MSWKDFFYYHRRERVAIILLLILIVLTIVMNEILKKNNVNNVNNVLIQNDSLVEEFDQFHRLLKNRESVAYPTIENESNRQYYVENRRNNERRLKSDGFSTHSDKNSSFVSSFSGSIKLAEGETILLNESDTTDWKKIPGIGSTYASRIVKYRDLLGGFVTVDQLREVYGIDDELFAKIYPYLKVDGKYTKIAVNTLEFKELLRHPYLNYKQVKAIFDLRRRKGNVSSINELAMLNEFTAEDIERLNPYLEF